MRNALVVARRELAQLFHSPLAYIFLVLFVVLVQLLPVLVLFTQNTADLRMFFDTLPWGVVLFAAFVTMRSWAEERQENTYEMLLTFPMKDHELVLGKFAASLFFLLLGLACTFTLPLTLIVVGDPDGGAIAAGYAGNALLAAMWCAGGIFVSGLTRSQLLAVIVTAFLAIVSLILGTEIVATLLDTKFGGVGSLLESMVGGWSHYASFEKGVAELSDTSYFLAWTAAFLWLNTLYVGQRRSPGTAATLSFGTPLALGCAMLVGRLTAGASWGRADLTEDRLYTLSPATVRVLTRAKVPVRVTYYVSPRDDLPKELQNLEREVLDRLREMEIASGGRIATRVSHLKAEEAIRAAEEDLAEEEDPSKALERAGKETSQERRVAAKGVRPFPVASLARTETSTKLIYSSLSVRYREKDEELLPRILPEHLGQLEYTLAQTVARLVRARPPRIALHLGKEQLDPQTLQMYAQRGIEVPDPFSQVADLLRAEKFDVERVALSAHEPLPDDYDALVVVAPAPLDERQKWEINRALVEGRPTLLALQRYRWEYAIEGRGIRPVPHEEDPGLDDVLGAQGLGVSKAILMDEERVQLNVPVSGGGIQGSAPLAVPMHVLVKPPQMNADSSITRQLPRILYTWGTGLTLDERKLAAKSLAVTRLFSSSPKSWTCEADRRKLQFKVPPSGYDPQTLAVLVRGQFQDAFAGKPRPAWEIRMEDMMQGGRPRPAPPDTPEQGARPAPGQLVLIGCASQWQSGLLTVAGFGNAHLLLNCLDSLTLDEDLLQVRARQASDRSFNRPSDTAVVFWTALPLGVVPLVIVGVGLAIGVVRMRRREAWESEHGR